MGIKKFFKKHLRDIATVVGFAVGGPAGAAVGQGIGSLAEGRDPLKSLMSAGKIYGGASFAQGAGFQGGGGSTGFDPSTLQAPDMNTYEMDPNQLRNRPIVTQNPNNLSGELNIQTKNWWEY